MPLDLPVLTTDRLILRLALREDADALLDYYLINRDFLAPFEPTKDEQFYTLSFWQEQIERSLIEYNYDQAIRFCLFERHDPTKVIGRINFTQIQRWASHSCLLGYSLAEQKQGQGYMTEALKGSIQFMFMALNLHRVMANYMPRNQRSANVLRRLGFVVEGYARDYILINGQWEDHILTSLTNPTWQ